MGVSQWAGVIKSYDAKVPAPTFVEGSKGANGFTRQTVVQAASLAIEYQSGQHVTVTLTTNAAFVFAAPTFGGVAFSALSSSQAAALAGVLLRITVSNTSGGAHGAGTFNAAFKTIGNWPATADTTNRTMEFEWNGTNWIEQWQTSADVAN